MIHQKARSVKGFLRLAPLGGISLPAVCHIDANYFYGQVEALFRPDIRGKAFVVGGDQLSRKGIVLTKSPLAKKYGIKTGVSIREALNVYPKLIVIPANYPLYLHFSKRMREIVLQHTDTIKPFGSDEMLSQINDNIPYHKSRVIRNLTENANK